MPQLPLRPLAAAALLAAGACIPYTVGSTAQTVPAHTTTSTASWYFIPNAFKEPGDTVIAPMVGADAELRHGLSARSDVGLRLVPGGVVVNHKRRLGADTSHTRAAVAVMAGAGIVNLGEHAHLEATLIKSGRQAGTLTPYGGVRAMQVIPIGAGAVHDSPTLGLFGGVRIGDQHFTITPELGVFYDRSALHLRSAEVIIVPAVTVQRGDRGRRGGGWPWGLGR
jgi:hypothetical protein